MEYNIKADLEKAAKHAEDARALVDVAKSEGRELSTEENAAFDKHMNLHQNAENAANGSLILPFKFHIENGDGAWLFKYASVLFAKYAHVPRRVVSSSPISANNSALIVATSALAAARPISMPCALSIRHPPRRKHNQRISTTQLCRRLRLLRRSHICRPPNRCGNARNYSTRNSARCYRRRRR